MANYVTPTVGQVTANDSANTKALVPEIWAAEIAKNRTDNLVLWGLINHEYQSEIGQMGDVLHINFVSEIDDDPSSNSSVTTASTIDSLDVTQQDLLIDRYIRKAVGIQDVAKAQSKYEMRSHYIERLGRFFARALDEEVMKKAVSDFSHEHTTTGTSGALTFEDVVDAATMLDSKNVPVSQRAIVVNGVGLGDLRKVEEFTLYSHTGERALVEGERGIVGHIYNMPVYLSEAIKADGSGDLNFLMFHKEAVIAATQSVPKTETGREKLIGIDYIVGSQLWGVKVLRPDHGVVIKRAAPATTSTTTTTTTTE